MSRKRSARATRRDGRSTQSTWSRPNVRTGAEETFYANCSCSRCSWRDWRRSRDAGGRERLYGLRHQREGQHGLRHRHREAGGRQDGQSRPAPARHHPVATTASGSSSAPATTTTCRSIDAKTLEIVKTLPSGPDPELLMLHPVGNPLYIANEDDNLVTVVDIETGKSLPRSRSASSRRAWASARTARCWSTPPKRPTWRISSTRRRTRRRQRAGRSAARASPSSTPDGTQLWVSAEIGGTVTVIDPATRKIMHKIELRGAGRARRSHPAGRHPDHARRQEGVRRARPGQPRGGHRHGDVRRCEKYLLVGQRVWQMDFTPDDKLLFTTNGASNDVSVIDVANEKVVQVDPRRRATLGAWSSRRSNNRARS